MDQCRGLHQVCYSTVAMKCKKYIYKRERPREQHPKHMNAEDKQYNSHTNTYTHQHRLINTQQQDRESMTQQLKDMEGTSPLMIQQLVRNTRNSCWTVSNMEDSQNPVLLISREAFKNQGSIHNTSRGQWTWTCAACEAIVIQREELQSECVCQMINAFPNFIRHSQIHV